MRAAAVAAVLALAAACGDSGTGARPSAPATATATTTPTPSATSLSPEADAIRAAVAKTLAACPCAIDIRSFGEGEGGYSASFSGVYDPATQTTSLRNKDDKSVLVRIVEGRTFVLAGGAWLELDFSGMPAKAQSVLAALTLADPRIPFAFASNVTFMDPVTETKVRHGKEYEVEIDARAAAAATGPWADLVGRIFTNDQIYDSVVLGAGGTFTGVSLDTDATPTEDYSFSVDLFVTKTGVRAPAVTIPKNARKVDVATLKL